MGSRPIMSGMSPMRQIAAIALIAVAASFTLTATIYYSYYGQDDRFWEAMIMSLIVPWGISIPMGWYFTQQRQKFMMMTAQLRQTEEDLRMANRELEHKASYDAMTGMLNRDTFFDRLSEKRTGNNDHILMIVDVDHFKTINDSFGHPAGDQALMLLASIFRRILRKGDLIGRIGGEEFGIFLPDTAEAEGKIVGEMIRSEVENTPFEPHPGFRHVITVSIGITDAAARHEQSVVMRNADNALFAAKHSGRNKVLVFDPGMRSKPCMAMGSIGAVNPNKVGSARAVARNQ
ncbi:GGDEF domain-containing protein [Alterisphingorhabdus coralli]|uniref:diguanylate cyclase n=1 Tax=Alterisphingorhabdus coralli TaxID=3071408 RepID=A0AA97F939_9SPHN|nr:GGDEF domain-containing protein [Parasphingorhabdus sp. SCSIO 66989]WOE76228.1 GGDEF domain-containing protein [Parasphingorhabdus sp. SCSIO 66989]